MEGIYTNNADESVTITFGGESATFAEPRKMGFFDKLAVFINNRFAMGFTKPKISICKNNISIRNGE